MRKALALALVIAALVGGAGRLRAGDREQALAVIDQGIRAHGGEQALARTRIRDRHARAAWLIQTRQIRFTTDLLMDLPERFRDVIEVEGEGGVKARAVQVVNGAKGWRSTGGATTDLTKEELDDLREEAYLIWLTTLVPLKGAGFELSTLPDANVNGKPAGGLKVGSPGHGTVLLYFDKQSGLLSKAQRQARVVGLEVPKEYLYSDYKDFEGVKLPTLHVEMLKGEKTLEMTITSYRFPASVGEKEFARP